MKYSHDYSSSNNSEINEDLLYNTFLSELERTPDLKIRIDLVLNFWLENRGAYASQLKDLLYVMMEEAEKNKESYVLGWCHFMLGWLILDHNQIEEDGVRKEAVAFFVKAQEEFKEIGQIEAQIRAINGEASAYGQYGYYHKALERYLSSLGLAEKIKNDLLVNIIAGNVASLLVNLKQFEDAIEYFSLAESVEIDSPDEMAIQYSNFSIAYRGMGDLVNAEKKALKALKLSKDGGGNSFARAHSLLELALIRLRQGRYRVAKPIFEKCLQMANDKNMPRMKAISLLHLGIIEQANGNYEGSFSFLQEALAIAQASKTKNIEAETLFAIAKVHEESGDYINAYNVLKAGKKIESELFNEETVNKIGVLKVQQAQKEDLIYKDLYNRINTISQIGQAITSKLDIKEIGDIIYCHLNNLMDVNNLAIGLFDEEKQEILYKIFIKDNKYLKEFSTNLKNNQSLEARCISSRKGFMINDVSKENAFTSCEGVRSILSKGVNSFICSPLLLREKILGLITVQSDRTSAYAEHHVDILNALAAYIAIALENEKLFSSVTHLATTDSLTGLSNRRHTFEQADKEFARNKRYKKPLTVIVADIDKFKSVNDNFGHAAGDMVLREVSYAFTNVIRDSDLLGRIGGEEFLFVLPNTASKEAEILARRLQEEISEKEYFVLDKDIKITASFGLAEVELADKDISDTIKRADEMLYEAKRAGGNIVKSARDLK